MELAKRVKRFLCLSYPHPGSKPADPTRYAALWQKWHDAAINDHKLLKTPALLHAIFYALKPALFLALLVISCHIVTALGSAITLKQLLTQLSDPNSQASNFWLGAGCIALTALSWLCLNYCFYLADVIGTGARTYVESRLALHKNLAAEDLPFNVLTLFDREATRIEMFFSGLITLILAVFTIIFTSLFFFYVLGISAVAALFITALSSISIYLISRQLKAVWAGVSKEAAQRISVGSYGLNNILQIGLKNWNEEIMGFYTKARDAESCALKKAARLLAWISLISNSTPALALLSSALMQLAVTGTINLPAVLAAIALLGGLKSVANSLPTVIQNLSKGKAGEKNIQRYLNAMLNADDIFACQTLATTTARHFAVTGLSGSGKTHFLKRLAQTKKDPVYIPDEPWLYTGGLRNNLALYRSNFTDEEVQAALTWSRLPESFICQYIAEKGNPAVKKCSLSRGQGKRLEICRALLCQPEWIFIDQPTSGLDSTLAEHFLSSLLRGPWKDINVVYVTDKPQEIAAAQAIITVQDGLLSKMVANQITSCHHNLKTPTNASEWPQTVLPPPSPQNERHPSEMAKLSQPRTLFNSLKQFGILKIIFGCGLLFMFKEGLTIYGDILITGGRLSREGLFIILLLFSIIIISALISMLSSLFTVRKIIEKSSVHCLTYLRQILNPALTLKLRKNLEQDKAQKISWDQRRNDEILPQLILESVNAAAILMGTAAYIFISNDWMLIPFIIIALTYFYALNTQLPLLQKFNQDEINTTALLFSRVESVKQSAGRFAVAPDKNYLFHWLKPVLQQRVYCSLDNAAARCWFSFKLDLNGLLFLSFIVIMTTSLHQQGLITPLEILALSLSYNIIAVFGRFGRCIIELRQALDSADRIAVDKPVAVANAAIFPPKDHAIPLISFKQVCYYIEKNNLSGIDRHYILNRFNAAFYRHDVVVITGPSGSGKSTFARLIVGALLPEKGDIEIFGQYKSYMAQPHFKDIQLLTSDPLFEPAISADSFEQSVDWRSQQNLSKSEKQKLAIRAMLIDPPTVVILDEATSEMKSEAEFEFVENLISSFPETLFVILTHNLSLSSLATRYYDFNHQGEMVEVLAENSPDTSVQ